MTIKSSSQMRPGAARREPQKSPFPPIGDLARPAQTKPAQEPRSPWMPPAGHNSPPPTIKNSVRPEILHTPKKEGEPLDSLWERMRLLSNGIFYPWGEVSVKHFDAFDQAKLRRAVKNQNLTVLLDVLSSTCSQDVREFAYGDFQALCLWHKLNDYLQVRQNLTWNSKYGVRGNAEIKKTKLKEVHLNATAEEFLEWKLKGLAVATCRDLELMVSQTLDEDTLYLYDKAQHIDPAPLADRIAELSGEDPIASVTARIEELNRRGLPFWDVIDDFVARFSDYGIQEIANVQLKTEQFDPLVAIESLRSTETDANLEEANLIESFAANGKTYTPQIEEVPLVFNLWSMFPYTS
jgi:hypothetical protein